MYFPGKHSRKKTLLSQNVNANQMSLAFFFSPACVLYLETSRKLVVNNLS